MGSNEYYLVLWVLLCIIGQYWVLLVSNGYFWVLLNSIGEFWVLLDTIWYYWLVTVRIKLALILAQLQSQLDIWFLHFIFIDKLRPKSQAQNLVCGQRMITKNGLYHHNIFITPPLPTCAYVNGPLHWLKPLISHTTLQLESQLPMLYKSDLTLFESSCPPPPRPPRLK